MICCMKHREPQQSERPRDLIASDDGVVAKIECQRDPYETLDDLMTVVEALCPEWPRREPFTGKEEFKL
jgi:hypothetical protein